MRKSALIGVVAGLLSLTACSGISASQSSGIAAGDNRPGESYASYDPSAYPEGMDASPVESPSPTATPTPEDAVQTFGSAYTWADGLALTISEPKEYSPSETASYDKKYSKFVVFDVTVVNKTGKAWDPGMISMSAQSANEEASEVYDSGKLPNKPQTKLLDGREAKFKIALAVHDSSDIVMEVHPDYDHDSVLFQKK